MIAIWNNGNEDGHLTFVDVGDSAGLRLASHVVGLLRMFKNPNGCAQRQAIVASADAMVFSDRLRAITPDRWACLAFDGSDGLLSGYNPVELDRICRALPPKFFEWAMIQDVPGIAERIGRLPRTR